MDSAKIFALGLAAGLAIHALMRNRGKQAQNETAAKETSIAAKSSSKKSKAKKKKDTSAASAAVDSKPKSEPAREVSPPPAIEQVPATSAAQTTSQKKKNKKSKQSQPSQQSNGNESYAALAETTPASLNNETLRAKADAAQIAFTASLGDMRDAEVDPLPAGYSSVARIPAPEVEAPKPKLSKKELDDGWSSVGGTFSATAGAKTNGSTPAVNMNGVAKASIASNNPFAALPDDATTSSVRRIPAKTTVKSNGTSNGWTVAGSTSTKSKPTAVNGAAAETKKQRSNANKTQAKKAAKEEADRLQAERLANHRRQQANQAAKQREVAARPQPKSVPGSSKVNAAKASVDLNGRLVWD